MRLIFHPFFVEDVQGIFDYYKSEAGESIAKRFIEELESTKQIIAENPLIFSRDKIGVHKAMLETFPYHVCFELKNNVVFVFMLRHARRHPRYGFGRR